MDHSIERRLEPLFALSAAIVCGQGDGFRALGEGEENHLADFRRNPLKRLKMGKERERKDL